jgi:hypothetical protein
VLERHEQASEAEADWSTPDAPPPAAAFAVDAGDIVGVIDRMELLMIAPIPDEGAVEQLYCIKAPGHSMPIGPGFVPAAKLRPAQALVAVDAFEAEYGLEISLARGPLMASLIAHRHHIISSARLDAFDLGLMASLMASLIAHVIRSARLDAHQLRYLV